MKRFPSHSLLLAVLLAVAALAGCRGGVTPIRTLLDDPGRYDRTVVRIAGTVGPSLGVLGYAAYEVDDGTGTLPVVTTTGGAPRQGAKVAVEGEFRNGFTLGTRTAAVIVESSRREP